MVTSLRCILLFSFFVGALNQSTDAIAGLWWFGKDETGLKKHTPEWYAYRARQPIGGRQVASHGKLWPPFHRPTGPEQSFAQKYHASHYWPYPYTMQDRTIVEDHLTAQSAAGWANATMLHHHHFDAETGALNVSGRSHLHWILTRVPPEYRRIHVASALDAATSQQRYAIVMQELSANLGPEELPVVEMRYQPALMGRPASEVQQYQDLAKASMLPPIVTYGLNGDASAASGE